MKFWLWFNQYEGKCAQFYARADGTMTVEPCDQREEMHRFMRGELIISQQEAEPATDHSDSDG